MSANSGLPICDLEIRIQSFEDGLCGFAHETIPDRNARISQSLSPLKCLPPGKPEIKDNLGKNVQGVIRTYNEGDSLYLICESQGGKPPPTLTWWRGPALIDDTFEVVTSSTLVRNELQLETLTRRDLMTEITCQASNNNVSAPIKSSVSLDLNCKLKFSFH
ncbi:ig-like domain-containing protein [Trichonephila inaurata madagascariensis]|uniref:Ig-like domain-containing protein n=1 Tax=Trichonephila inaurata madagascariensis TaxID=2747483 RepID=A0A8X7C3U3_9ARAC|nr:ig-like domain-containing protein [Trichonephila inaurata madagascariensis]